MMKNVLLAVAISGVMASAQAGVLINEGFDDVSALGSKGWIIDNASSPAGPLTWFQGDQSVFRAQNGAPNSYAAINYLTGKDGGTLANWLITPEFSTVMGTSVSFWLRADPVANYSDQVKFGVSAGGSALTEFALSQAVTVATGEWTKYVFNLAPTNGTMRFAIQYTGMADSANYLGLDNLRVTEIPEPASLLILAAGAVGLVAARRRKRA
ncbi:choice-of-anchor J family PEP-CTERM protein [Massilia sp. HP4]|uniref:choice-of-anchor J family PEP-CTERM protein n=1 Tax=Massilia sp. HP4 TaxID=2562316 RepID=UPI0010C0FD97|nr:choice-of-anchor J domain-containing protein [Massilia sp. HP4]